MKVVLLIDGGFLRVEARNKKLQYDCDFIERFAHTCIGEQETLLRIMYYDCPQFRGVRSLPISGKDKHFTASDHWIDDLGSRDLFAVRMGTLAFRGWSLRKPAVTGRSLQDDDFKPAFEQKGVDMRIGLDIATFADERTVDRIILVSADADMIPAMKHARKKGIQIVAVQLPPPAYKLNEKFMAHADFRRPVSLLNADPPEPQ
jgi:uncharacterized LabA/DUF88 family protein